MDGELLARPQRWESNEEPPKIVVVPGRDDSGPALGRGERVLARLEQVEDGYEARVIKRLGARARIVFSVSLTIGPNGTRIAPIDRKSRTAFTVDTRDLASAKNNELVVCEPVPPRLGQPMRTRGRTARPIWMRRAPSA